MPGLGHDVGELGRVGPYSPAGTHPDCRTGRPTARAERPCRAWVTMSASSAGWVPTVLQGPPHRLDHLPLDAVPERQREMRQVPESGVDSTASFSTAGKAGPQVDRPRQVDLPAAACRTAPKRPAALSGP